MNILITGGAGYIGSHTAYKLIKAGHNVTILDNLEKGHQETLDVLRQKAGDFKFINVDLRDIKGLRTALSKSVINSVIHFAGYIEVGRSAKEPQEFFENNTVGSQNLFKVLIENNIKKLIFSSTAAVYKPQDKLLNENDTLAPESPYGTSKLLTERMLESYAKFANFNSIALRYFNPAGSFGGLIGERHLPETHLIPRLLRAFISDNINFGIFGNDYDTPDGTAVRDYIHLEDLVDAHISALKFLENNTGHHKFNVASGIGTSVQKMVDTAQKVLGKKLNYKIHPRRKGDADRLVASPNKINTEIGWKTKYDIEDIIKSAWEYERIRPANDYN